MGARIGIALVQPDGEALYTAPAVHGLDDSEWRRAEPRVLDYLKALGVVDPAEIERLRERVRLRAEARALATPLEDPVEAAIEEAHALLNEWLAAELEIEADANTLFAARAAVLGGGVPGWTARWAGLAHESLAPAIRAACIAPVPERAPLVMEPSQIHLCCHRLRARLARGLGWLLGGSGTGTSQAGGHS